MDDLFSRFSDIGGMDFDESAYWLEADFLLTEIVSQMVNVMHIPLGVTLFLKGAVVTGMLVSEQEFLRELSKVFIETAKRNVPLQTEEEVRRLEEAFDFTGLAEDQKAPLLRRKLVGLDDYADPDSDYPDIDYDEEDDEDDDVPEPIRYLHLRDMVVLTPSPSLNFTQGVLPIVRIRMNAIDGWILGQATPMDSFPPPPPEDDDSSGEILH
jgi:hypothetical protein